jgi:prepilin-type processing-associated H-X9-DG protein
MVMCRSNLTALGTSVLIYANDFDGRYPAAERWCDLLLKHSEGELTEKSFRCPANKKERCSFAINPNCEPNSPEDVVLLFESRGGWNQYGGPELLAPQNHEGRGCNILFNDGHVYFENVKSIPKLNWGDEKGEK